MNQDNLLDQPIKNESNPNRWKYAIIAILTLAITGLGFSFLEKWISGITMITESIVICIVLYFFIKKVGHEYFEVTQLFSWGTLIVFGGYLIFNTISYFLGTLSYVDDLQQFTLYNLGALVRSMVLGYLLSLGAFHLIKDKNWGMPILMIITSWMLLTIFTF